MNRSLLRRLVQRELHLGDLANRHAWSNEELLDHKQRLVSLAVDRRRFLAAAAGAGVLAACKTGGSGGAETLAATPDGKPQVVILGAGLAGLMAAHQLAKQGYETVIYEASDRAGGRVQTKGGFNADGMFIELGAEFVDIPHHHLNGLAEELGVAVDEYVDASLGLEKEVFFMGGKLIDMDSFLPEFRKLAALIRTDTEAIRQGGELVYPTRGKPGPAPRLDQISLAQYLQEKQRQGISADFTRLIDVMYLGMYGLECEEQSVYNLLMLIDIDSEELAIYGDSDESRRVRGGNSRLVEALEQAVRKRTPIELGHKLVRMRDDGSAFTLDFATGGASKTVRAEALICALPFTTLRDVEGIDKLDLSPAKAEAIRSLGMATNSKFVIGFKEAFWTKGSKIVPPNYGTVFTDRLTKEVRASSNNQSGKSGIILNYLGGKQGKLVSPKLVAETLDHLEFLYPGSRTLADGNKNLRHWPSDPFAKASYVCFRPGHYTAMGGYEEPVELKGRLVFAGEHMSTDWGGYMEGALGTGKAAAEAIAQQGGLELTPQAPMRRRARRA